MSTLLLPLGTIVNTNAMKSIQAFQGLVNKLKLGVQILPLVKELNPLFVGFNLGAFTKVQFAEQLLATIEKSIPVTNKAEYQSDWKEIFMKEWVEAWNAMCVVDERAIQIFQMISTRSDIHFEIYSDTNEPHFDFIRTEISKKLGVDLNVNTTFSCGSSIKELISIIKLKHAEDIKNQQCSIVIGNPEHIQEASLRKIGEQKNQSILSVAQGELNILPLKDQYLTPDLLEKFLREIKPTQPIVFSAQASSSSSSSTTTQVTNNSSASNDSTTRMGSVAKK